MFLLRLSTIALLPALIIQGNKVKKNTPRLPEPMGDRHGRSGQGKTLSILIIGDSAAAGVGVKQQQDALSGSILAELEHEYEITWALHAKTGRTSAHVIRAITALDNQHYDVIVSSVGVNDVTKLMSAKTWIKQQDQLYRLVQQKFSPHLIIAASVPPVDQFPALPQPLAWLFGQYAKKMNLELKQYVKKHSDIQCIEYDLAQYQQQQLTMAEDGFHPSKEIYQLWAKSIAEKIRQRF